MAQLRNSILKVVTPLLCISATTSANSTVIIDPNDYSCVAELRSEQFGIFQARVYANTKSDYKSVEGNWISGSLKSPSMGAFWPDKSLESGRFFVTYSVSSAHKVRVEIGDCHGNQAICGRSAHYATNFRQTEGFVQADALWGAVLAIGRVHGDIYFQVQDDTGAALREDKLPVATLETVESEMRRLMATVEAGEASLKARC